MKLRADVGAADANVLQIGVSHHSTTHMHDDSHIEGKNTHDDGCPPFVGVRPVLGVF
jgi:hypothetical protein